MEEAILIKEIEKILWPYPFLRLCGYIQLTTSLAKDVVQLIRSLAQRNHSVSICLLIPRSYTLMEQPLIFYDFIQSKEAIEYCVRSMTFRKYFKEASFYPACIVLKKKKIIL